MKLQLEVLESVGPNYKSVKGEIANLFILDRSLDYATCLLSPLTYESLLDEVISSFFYLRSTGLESGFSPLTTLPVVRRWVF